MADLPSGTVTFLFTDVEGSTKLLHELGAEAYDDALIEHRRVLRETFVGHGGVEVDTQGDAFFYAFPTAEGALLAAREGQAALSEGPISVRVGLHTGTPHIGQEGYIGDDVHVAARVAATGHGGQVVLSKATAELVELELIDLGEHRLKDTPTAVPIFQLGDASFPPLKTISNTNLPTPASSFVGRDDELLEVLSRFEEGARLVTLTGPGGTGKTRLAIEAAATLVPEYKAGVFWVGLATLRDPALVTETIAQTLGAKDGLAGHIGDRELLLLLDNLEQVIDCAPDLSEVLTSCPNLTLIVTSRELLRISGEVEYAVPPLAESEAVELFCARSQLDADGTIAELCRRLDDMPLAVELAAARTTALTPVQILDRLSQRLDLLKGGRDADPRQQTLRATIEWSYELLSSDEQQLFARLSVVSGGCTLDAAVEVCDADLDTLQSLVDVGDLADTHFAHAAYFAALAARGAAQMPDSHREWIDRFAAERDNLRAAIGCSLDQNHPLLGYPLATAYGVLCTYQGPLGEGRSWLTAVLQQNGDVPADLRHSALLRAAGLAERQKDLDVARELAQEGLELARAQGDAHAVAKATLVLGLVEGDAGNFEASETLLREALGLFAVAGGDREVRETLGMLGFLYLSQEDYGQAISVCERALAMSRMAGDSRGLMGAATNLGHALARTGETHSALRLQREALVLTEEQLDLQATGEILLDVAALAGAAQEPTTAGMILGGITALAKTAEFALMPVEIKWFDEIVDEVRGSLGADGVERALSEGSQLSYQELVAFAIEFIDSQA